MFTLKILTLYQIGTILRVTGRVLGLWPEHVRFDRDKHITIHGQHADESNKGSLENVMPEALIQTFNLPYDYASVMHFHAKVCEMSREIQACV